MMFIDPISVKALAMIVLASTQGDNAVRLGLPFNVEDHGSSWLVRSTSYTDQTIKSKYVTFSIYFRKDSAEIIGIGFEARPLLSSVEEQRAKTQLSRIDFDRLYGPPQPFGPGGYFFAINKQMVVALYGGFINTPAAALDYAEVLLRLSKDAPVPPRQTLKAEERDGVWHVTMSTAQGSKPSEDVLSFSRTTGKVLSGGL